MSCDADALDTGTSDENVPCTSVVSCRLDALDMIEMPSEVDTMTVSCGVDDLCTTSCDVDASDAARISVEENELDAGPTSCDVDSLDTESTSSKVDALDEGRTSCEISVLTREEPSCEVLFSGYSSRKVLDSR